MDALTPLLIAKALDGLSARADATAANIANASSRNYRPVRVDFEGRLRAAARRGASAVVDVRAEPVLAPPPRVATEMRLDLELATAAQTSMRYAALIDVLGRELAISRAAMTGGR